MTTQTVSNAVATRDAGPIKFMWSKRSHLSTVLPKSVDVEAFLGTAAGALYASDVPGKNLTLWKCAQSNPDSLFVALMECAVLGHLPGTEEYYLTPRMDHGRMKVLGIEGYRGVIERMFRSGAVAKPVVREVCASDYFLYVEGEMDKPVHKWGGDGTTGASFFSSKPRGEMVGVYAYAELVTGAISRVVTLTRDDVFAARDSGGYKPDDVYSPWNRLDGGPAHPEFKGRSMWWKTGAKRLEPWVPTSAEYRRESLRASAAAAEHAISSRQFPALPPAAAVNTGTGEVVDAEIVDETDVPPAAEQVPQPAEAHTTPAGPAGGTQDPGPGPDDPAWKQALKAAQAQFKRFTGDDQAARLDYARRLLRVNEVLSFNDLTLEELRQIGEVLSGLKDRAQLDALLDGGEVPHAE
jgi:recombination protein RecT